LARKPASMHIQKKLFTNKIKDSWSIFSCSK